MSKTLSAGQATALAKTSWNVFWIVKMEFDSPVGTRYYSNRADLDLGVTTEPLLSNLPSVNRMIQGDVGPSLTLPSDKFSILLEGDCNLEHELLDIEPRGTVVTVYVVMKQVAAIAESDWIELAKYRVDDFELQPDKIWFTCLNFFEQILNAQAGENIVRSDFPNAADNAFGQVKPRIYGQIPRSPCPCIDAGPRTTISVTLEIGATSMVLQTGDVAAFGLATFGIVWVENEVIQWAGVSGDTLTGLVRGLQETVDGQHEAGATAWFVPQSWAFLVAAHEAFAVADFQVNGHARGNISSLVESGNHIQRVTPQPFILPGQPFQFLIIPTGTTPTDGTPELEFEVAGEIGITNPLNSIDAGRERFTNFARLTPNEIGNSGLFLKLKVPLVPRFETVTRCILRINYSARIHKDENGDLVWPAGKIFWSVKNDPLGAAQSDEIAEPQAENVINENLFIEGGDSTGFFDKESGDPILNILGLTALYESTGGSPGNFGHFSDGDEYDNISVTMNGIAGSPGSQQPKAPVRLRVLDSAVIAEGVYPKIGFRYTAQATNFIVENEPSLRVQVTAGDNGNEIVFHPAGTGQSFTNEITLLANWTRDDVIGARFRFSSVINGQLETTTRWQITNVEIFVEAKFDIEGANTPLTGTVGDVNNANSYLVFQELDITNLVNANGGLGVVDSEVFPAVVTAGMFDENLVIGIADNEVLAINRTQILIYNFEFDFTLQGTVKQLARPDTLAATAKVDGKPNAGDTAALSGPEEVILDVLTSLIGVDVGDIDTASLTSALAPVLSDTPAYRLDWRQESVGTGLGIFTQVCSDSGIRVFIEGGKIKFAPELSAIRSDAISVFTPDDRSRDKGLIVTRMHTPGALVTNELTIQYKRAFDSGQGFSAEVTSIDATSQSSALGVRAKTLSGSFLSDDDSAAARAARGVADFTLPRLIAQIPSNFGTTDNEIGDVVRVSDPTARIFGMAGRIFGAGFNGPATPVFNIALDTREEFIFGSIDPAGVSIRNGELRFFAEGELVAILKESGILFLRDIVHERPMPSSLFLSAILANDERHTGVPALAIGVRFEDDFGFSAFFDLSAFGGLVVSEVREDGRFPLPASESPDFNAAGTVYPNPFVIEAAGGTYFSVDGLRTHMRLENTTAGLSETEAILHVKEIRENAL